jgi:hypothetical protein
MIPVKTPVKREKVKNTGKRLKKKLCFIQKKYIHTTVDRVCMYDAQTLTPIKLKRPSPRQYTQDIVNTAAIVPNKLKKNVGLRNVPPTIEPRNTLSKVTINASRKPKNISVISVITLARPSLIQGLGKGMSASTRCRTTARATIKESKYILRLV